MKVLFVYKGMPPDNSNPIKDAQAESLVKHGVEVIMFPLLKRGFNGYLKEHFRLKKFLRANPVDIIHAHYSYKGIIAGSGIKGNTICSLMGSDVHDQNFFILWITKYYYRNVWKATIVKSERMLRYFPKAYLIPNGVDFNNFFPYDKDQALKESGLSKEKFNILFVTTNPEEKVKNLALARKAVKLTNNEKIALNVISSVKHKELNKFYNAADMLLLTSISEGSPNVVKEAMACNCPVVATDVGDVRKVIGDTEGCYVVSNDAVEIADKIIEVMNAAKRTKGRSKIEYLNSDVIAQKLIDLYKSVSS